MRVLIVEDEHKIANVIKEGLSEESFAVDACYDGDDGLASALNEDYDIIILDRMLPGGIDGIEICKTLRAEGNHTPILMLTAKDQVRDRVTGLNSGADDYLVKPFSFEELLARIRALLRRPTDSIGERLVVGDLSLNTVTKEVRRTGKIIGLSAKEFALLEYLLRNKDRVMSKQSIINHVWNFESDILPSTVEVFIVFLRAKIDKPFSGDNLIKTVRGFGYKIGESNE
jgi:DNA-binding response OmpR family regulator